MAGEPSVLGPVEGEVLAVIGVRYDDVLNIRSGPGIGSPIVATIEPTAVDVVARGRTRELPGSFWVEVEHLDAVGWVNLRFLTRLGEASVMTDEVLALLGGRPSHPDMAELGLMVAEAIASTDPHSHIVMVREPMGAATMVVWYDVVGFGDDSVRGVRLFVTGVISGSEFTLDSVAASPMCDRGLHNGECV